MGVITDILKGIPLNAVLREQLSALEKEMATLKAKVAILELENADLKAKLQKINSNKTIQRDICPYCKQPSGDVVDIKPHPTFPEVGMKIYYYQCRNCGKKYDRERTE
jgi:uncharacterized protein with PIN domain